MDMKVSQFRLGEIYRTADRILSVSFVDLVAGAFGEFAPLQAHQLRIERELYFFRIYKVCGGDAHRPYGFARGVVTQKKLVGALEYLA